LPKANVDRMVSASLPLGSKTSIEAKVVVQHLASEFVAFVTSEADAVSKARGDRCITSEHLIQAFENLGLGQYAASLGAML
ncbi:histone-fold-containing protein, partial [Pavlovales sp. CCMP2436]